jgi:5'-phosphate synthase pdxT subunit
MILLADEVVDGRDDQQLLGGLDITVRRNAFGSQVESFEQDLDVDGVGTVHGVFIRAPWVERVGPDVEVLARVGEHPVAVRQGSVVATSFHPELTDDARLHEAFVTRIVAESRGGQS